jgi:hypothetical protein
MRFLFPEGFADPGEDPAAAEFGGVLARRRGGTGIHHGPMPQHHQRGILEMVNGHGKVITDGGGGGK